MKKVVSIIIPVYNTEKYLSACVDSVLSQTYTNLDIILVNDGSTDGSSEICEGYKKVDSRIRVIQQKNSGVSVARNRALSVSKGEYIFFVDSDDLLYPKAVESLILHIDKSDLVIGNMSRITEDGSDAGIVTCVPEMYFSKDEMLRMLFEEEYGYQGYTISKLYKTQIIRENKLQFDERVAYNEDRLFVVNYLLKSENIKMVSSNIYKYRQRSDSAMGQIENLFNPKQLTELQAYEEMKQLVKESHPQIYFKISWLVFEKSLWWLTKVSRSMLDERSFLEKSMKENAKICISNPNKNVWEKLKIVVHCLIKK